MPVFLLLSTLLHAHESTIEKDTLLLPGRPPAPPHLSVLLWLRMLLAGPRGAPPVSAAHRNMQSPDTTGLETASSWL